MPATICRSSHPARAAGTLIAHRCCESFSKRPGERASGARCRRIGSGTLTLLMQWTGEPEFISCVPLLPIRASQSQAVIFTPNPPQARPSSWLFELSPGLDLLFFLERVPIWHGYTPL